MNHAVQFGRDKVLASCEHCIAIDYLGRFNDVIPDMPPESVVRIVECLRQGVYAKEKGRHRTSWTTHDFLKHKLQNSFQVSIAAAAEDWDTKV